MQESLDDAIWVLKSHAESTSRNSSLLPPNAHFPPTPQYPLSLTDQLQNAPLEAPGGLEASTAALLSTLTNAVRADPSILCKF